MRPVSDQFFIAIPAILGLLLLFAFATPMQMGNFSLAPNIAWLMSLIVAAFYPAAWPRGFAFLLGLLQDVLFGTPLGAQAVLTLLLVELVHSQARRHHHQLFRIRWLEAAGVLVVWHLLLWVIVRLTTGEELPIRQLINGGLASAIWYPIFYFVLTRLGDWVPAK